MLDTVKASYKGFLFRQRLLYIHTGLDEVRNVVRLRRPLNATGVVKTTARQAKRMTAQDFSSFEYLSSKGYRVHEKASTSLRPPRVWSNGPTNHY